MVFRARELRDDASDLELRRQLNEIQKELERELVSLRTPSPVTSLITDATYSANYGQIVRLAPPSTGQRLILPAPNLSVPNGKVVAVVEAASGALSVEAVDSTVNGSTTLTYLAGIGTVEFILTPTGWYAWSVTLVDYTALAGAGLTHTAGVLAVGAGDGIDVNADNVAVDVTDIVDGVSILEVATNNIQRAALTGEATAVAGLNAVTVTRSTNYNTSPWTGEHKFNADVFLGTLQTLSNQSGAINITRTAGAMRILVTSTNDITLGTVSGASEGNILCFEHAEASGAPNTVTVTHSTADDAFSCPGSVNLAIVGRGSFIAVARGNNWKILATTN